MTISKRLSARADTGMPGFRIEFPAASLIMPPGRRSGRRTKCRNIFIRKTNKVFKQNSLSNRSNDICCRRNGETNTRKAGAECGGVHDGVYLLSDLKV